MMPMRNRMAIAARILIAAAIPAAMVSCAPAAPPVGVPRQSINPPRVAPQQNPAGAPPESSSAPAPAAAPAKGTAAKELATWGPPPQNRAGGMTVQRLVEEGNAEGLKMENPFELDPDIEKEVEEEVGFFGTSMDRMRRITRYLNDKGYINFQYTQDLSLTAKEAFHARKGDCMAYTNLFMGISRHLKIPAYFVHVTEARDYYERDGMFFISSHMAVANGGEVVGRGIGMYTMVVDFTVETTDVGLQVYQSIDDVVAVALFYNNVAVDHLMQGDPEYAEKLLRFLISRLPGVREVYNNLGVVLMRQGKYEETLQVLQRAIALFPGYHPLYTNAVQAALGAMDTQLAEKLKEDGEKWTRKDPFYLFNLGVEEYKKKEFTAAAEVFKRALKIKPDNPIILFWLARARLSSGQTQQGINDFAKAQELAPNHPMIALLRNEFPSLANVPSILVVPEKELAPPLPQKKNSARPSRNWGELP